MKRMNVENMLNTKVDVDFGDDGTTRNQEIMKGALSSEKILYLGGYDYSLDEILGITFCAGILAADKGYVPPNIFDEDMLDDINSVNRVAKERREAGDQEYLDMIAEFKEYIEQFHHDMGESIKILQKNGLIPGISTPKSQSRMYG